MRKHLVVVGVAASALLLAGGVAATSAGAEENPDIPGLPFAWPDLPGWSDFGYDSNDGDAADGDGAGGDAADGDAADGDAADGDAGDERDPDRDPNRADYADNSDDTSGPAGADYGDGAGADQPRGTLSQPNSSDMSDKDGQPAGNGQPARPAQAQRPAQPQQQAQRSQAQHSQAQRSQAQLQRDQAARRQAQLSTAGLAAAARRPVTAADVSASPNAPVQLRVLGLINQNRQRGGCDAVSLDGRLIDAANEHAADMARRRFFAHESPNGDNAGERVREAGYRWKRYGENIARGADSPYEVVNGWMHSPSHRKNIMDCSLHEMGIGLAISRAGTPYWVQDFATPAH